MTKINKPEKMDEFFNKRAASYDDHMKNNVTNFEKYYKMIADPITKTNEKIKILDIGCGTGLELKYIFEKAPNAQIIGVDISDELLELLLNKYQDMADQINVIKDSYLRLEFGENKFDYIVSVMTIHHLLYDTKKKLYENILKSLSDNGKYIEGDYVVSEEKEKNFLNQFRMQMNQEKINDGFFHIDIPFSIKTQKKLFTEVGYRNFDLIFKEKETAIYVGVK
jgi:tRNA (cmo5U34)-methyltransferase